MAGDHRPTVFTGWLQRKSWHLHRRSTLRDSLWTNTKRFGLGLGFPACQSGLEPCAQMLKEGLLPTLSGPLDLDGFHDVSQRSCPVLTPTSRTRLPQRFF